MKEKEEVGLGKLGNLNNGRIWLGDSSHRSNFRRADLAPRRPHTDTGRWIDWRMIIYYVMNCVSQCDKHTWYSVRSTP